MQIHFVTHTVSFHHIASARTTFDATNPLGACWSQGGALVGAFDSVEVQNLGISTVSSDFAATGGTATWTFEYNSMLNTADPNFIYQETDDGNGVRTGTTVFCVKFSLKSGGTTASFREMALVSTITYTGAFDPAGAEFETTPLDVQMESSEEAFSVTASVCDGTAVFNQGVEIPICVCADQYPLTILTLDTLAFSSSNSKTQGAIAGGVLDENGLTTFMGCSANEADTTYCCETRTYLSDEFFDFTDGTPVDQVSVSGFSQVIINGRRQLVRIGNSNKEDRGLQQQQSERVGFSTSIVVTDAAEDDIQVSSSKASTQIAAIMAAIIMAIAL